MTCLPNPARRRTELTVLGPVVSVQGLWARRAPRWYQHRGSRRTAPSALPRTTALRCPGLSNGSMSSLSSTAIWPAQGRGPRRARTRARLQCRAALGPAAAGRWSGSCRKPGHSCRPLGDHRRRQRRGAEPVLPRDASPRVADPGDVEHDRTRGQHAQQEHCRCDCPRSGRQVSQPQRSIDHCARRHQRAARRRRLTLPPPDREGEHGHRDRDEHGCAPRSAGLRTSSMSSTRACSHSPAPVVVTGTRARVPAASRAFTPARRVRAAGQAAPSASQPAAAVAPAPRRAAGQYDLVVST